MTSLKVPLDVRDRFAAAAAARGCSVRALLDQLSRQVADQALMDQAAEQMRRMQERDPEAWANYAVEGQAWEQGSIEPVEA